MFFALAWQDHTVIVLYLLAMITLGAYLSRKQRTEEEYFLAGRTMPWFAVGVSIIASLLSSLTYLAEPGEVWKSGVTHFWGKMLAIPLEMIFVWIFCIPFLMRFQFTTAYEYLEKRFGPTARIVGVGLFLCLVVAWMGFIVLVSSRALAQTSGMDLWVVILTVGIVATFYTVLGGLRAVIWTDVLQVALLIGGAGFVLVYVCLQTGSHPGEWYATVASSTTIRRAPVFSSDPFVRATMVTVAMNMFVWHVCTHTSNQMTVQRYFSTSSLKHARRSFVTGSLMGVLINSLLVVVGLAIFFYYNTGAGAALPSSIDMTGGRDADKVFPHFISTAMPPGVAGMILAAVLAAAMSSVDSGVNSIATVSTIEWRRWTESPTAPKTDHVVGAKIYTVVVGLAITMAAYGLDLLPGNENIVGNMPRTFNGFLTPLAAMFFIGIFFRRAGSVAAVAAAASGLATSLSLGYGKELFGLQSSSGQSLSVFLILPSSLLVAMTVGFIISLFENADQSRLAGLTWYTRDASTPPADAGPGDVPPRPSELGAP